MKSFKNILPSKKEKITKILKIASVVAVPFVLIFASKKMMDAVEEDKKERRRKEKEEKVLAYQNGYEDGYLEAIVDRGNEL